MKLECLPIYQRDERQIKSVLGGTGTGKSSLIKDLASKKQDVYRNATQINPDDYKNLLANSDVLGRKHNQYAHEENSMIFKKIVERLKKQPRPHMLMDVTTLGEERMGSARHFGKMNVR